MELNIQEVLNQVPLSKSLIHTNTTMHAFKHAYLLVCPQTYIHTKANTKENNNNIKRKEKNKRKNHKKDPIIY